MELFRVFGTVGLNDAQARQSLHNIDSQAENTGNKLNILGRIGGTVGKAVAAGATLAVGAMATVTGAIAKMGIDYNAAAESSQVAWNTLLGTQEKAKKMMADISQFAKSTQFDTTTVDAMAKYMNNAGYAGENLFKQLSKVADVAGAFNIPADSAQELAKQMAQVQMAGTAYTEDLNVLADRGVPIYSALAKVVGKNVAEVKKMASEGKISADIYNKAFDSISTSVKGASKAQSETFNGMTSTLQDNLSIIAGLLAKPLFEKMKQSLDTIMPILDRFSATLKDEGLKAALSELFGEDKVNKAISLFNTIRDAGVTAFNLLKDAVKFTSDNLNWIIPIMSGVVAGITSFKIISTIVTLYKLWKASTIAQTFAQGGLNAVLKANPIGLVVTAIGLLVAAGVYLYRNWDTVKEKTRQLWDKLGAFKGVATAVLGPIGFIIRAAVDLAENWDSTKSVWENVWNSIKRVAQRSVNEVIDSINSLIKKINKIPGVEIPLIAHVSYVETGKKTGSPGSGLSVSKKPTTARYAIGTNFAPGGLAMVGERGPELVNLPRGSKVKTANETEKMLNGKGNTYNFYPQKADFDEKDVVRAIQRMEVLYG